MELINAVIGRRSVRKFKSNKIPREIVREILTLARWAPSWGNTQPWEFYVLTGKPLEEFKKENRELLIKGQSSAPDVPMPEVWPDHLKRRYAEIGGILLKTLNINREDKEARNKLYEDMALLFGAPCLIVVCIPRNTLVEYSMLDVGLILQTLCLLAYDKGIGTCIMAMTVRHPGLLRKIMSIPEDRKIIMGVALGYPDQEFPLNNFERKRADVSEYVRWIND